MKVIIKYIDDETQEIIVEADDKTEFFNERQTHDEHGWAGMEMARDIAEGIAEALGVAVVQRYKR
jgi:ABC-type Zn uptake system ZnuABC Zn-binding protein ZnuA